MSSNHSQRANFLIIFNFFYSLAVKNETVLESLEAVRYKTSLAPSSYRYREAPTSKSIGNIFDIGWKKNLRQIMGDKVWEWFIPFKQNTVGDGTWFPINQELYRQAQEQAEIEHMSLQQQYNYRKQQRNLMRQEVASEANISVYSNGNDIHTHYRASEPSYEMNSLQTNNSAGSTDRYSNNFNPGNNESSQKFVSSPGQMHNQPNNNINNNNGHINTTTTITHDPSMMGAILNGNGVSSIGMRSTSSNRYKPSFNGFNQHESLSRSISPSLASLSGTTDKYSDYNQRPSSNLDDIDDLDYISNPKKVEKIPLTYLNHSID